MDEKTEQLRAEIIALAKEADADVVGSDLYVANTHAMHDKQAELKKHDPEAAQALIAELMEMRTGKK